MKVVLIKKYIEAYKDLLLNREKYRESFKWECLKNFWDNWNLGSEDFNSMYDQSFSSRVSSSLWYGEHRSPKSVMLEFIGHNPDFVRSMFRDLFDEDKDVVLRMNRFPDHCSQMIKELQKSNKSVDQHFHDDPKILSVYLAFRYPQVYTIFDYEEFRHMMQKVELRDIPESYDVERFFKICRALNNFLLKDEELMEIMSDILTGLEFYHGSSLLLTHDFYWCCSREEYGIN